MLESTAFTVGVQGLFTPRLYAPTGNIRSLERKFPGTFAPGSKSSRELSFQGANVPSGNFRSEEQKYRGAKRP